MMIEIPYDRGRAIEYAKRWALSRNPLFIDFTGGGGDCTNFISQCVFAGCPIMNYTDTFGWYYVSADNRAPAWSGVDEFFNFITQAPAFIEANGGTGPYGVEARMPSQIMVGDVVQLMNRNGEYYHTLIISGFEENDILVCAHSDDALDRRLSSYPYYSLRIIHILGGRLNLDTEGPFSRIIEGNEIVSLP